MARKRLTTLVAVAAGTLVATGAAAAGNGGVAPLSPMTKQAADIRDVYYYALGFAGALLLGGLAWIARSAAARRPAAPSARRPLAVAAVSIAAVAGVGSYGIVKLDGARNAPADARTVLAIYDGSTWTFVHPDLGNAKEQGVLSLEQSIPAEIQISPKSAPGRLWVQQLGGAIDAIPGRSTLLAVTPTRAGTFQSLDLDPAKRMGMLTVHVLSQADYQGIAKGGGSNGG